MKKQLSILLLSSLVVLAGCTSESVVPTSAPQVNNQTEAQDVSLIISPYVVNTEAIASAKMSRAGNPNFAVVGSSYSFYTFLGSDDETVSISVELLDKDGQRLKKLEFSNVRLLRNKVTTYTGPLYSQSTEASFTFSGTDEFETSGQDKTFD